MRTAFLCCLFLAVPVLADDKDKAEKLRKEIADLRAQLTEKEAELTRLEPVEMVPYLSLSKLKPNTVGPFATPSQPVVRGNTVIDRGGRPIRDTLYVEKVLDKHRVTATLRFGGLKGDAMAKQKLLITNFDTTGYTDGKKIAPELVYRVVGTEKIDDVTYAHVEVWTRPWSVPNK